MKMTPEEARLNAQIFKTFLYGVIHQWLRTLTGLGITLIPLFGILDYFIVPPEHLKYFWILRIINSLILLGQYFLIRYTQPSKYSFLHGYFTSAIIGFTIILMTVKLGGFNTSYYQGLNLVIIAVNFLIPWEFFHSAINGILMILLYIVVNGYTGAEFDYRMLINNLFFMSATVIISTSINYLRYNLIKQEFGLRNELKTARDALRGEMDIAKRIQTALLPNKHSLPHYEISAVMIPADEVGGDYYDIIETPGGETWMAIGDVSGHGVESGLIMMMTHTCIYSLVNQTKKALPSNILEKVNYVIKENIHRLDVSRYVTLTIIKMEEDHIFHSGKHQDIFIYRAATKKVEIVVSHGTWIGIIDDMSSYLKDSRVDMNVGDVILLYTDGLTEAENHRNELYSDKRLLELFEQNAHQPVKTIVEVIINDVASYQKVQSDDITLLVCRRI